MGNGVRNRLLIFAMSKSKGSGLVDENAIVMICQNERRTNQRGQASLMKTTVVMIGQNGEAIITPTDQRRDADYRWTDAQDST